MSLFDKLDFGGIGGAVSDIFGGVAAGKTATGYQAQALGYRKAAQISEWNRQIAEQAGQITEVQQQRDLYKVLGAQQSASAAGNIETSGSALDVLRDSAQQGALSKQLIGRQNAITDLGYKQERASYESMAASADASAAAAKAQKKGGIFGGILKAVGAIAPLVIASDETLKEDIRLVHRRADGVGIYHFRYKGQPTTFEGVMAQDVQRARPDAVYTEDNGTLAVDYEAIGVTPRVVEDA